MIGEIRQNFTEASASVGLILATALEVIVILMRVLNEGDDYEIECCCLIKDLRVVVQFRLVPMFIFQC